MANQHLKIKSTLTSLEVVNHLERLVASLKEGTVYIRKGSEAISLKPCEPVSLELEAEVKADKDAMREKLSIELKWKKREVVVEEETFVISHQEPCNEESGC